MAQCLVRALKELGHLQEVTGRKCPIKQSFKPYLKNQQMPIFTLSVKTNPQTIV